MPVKWEDMTPAERKKRAAHHMGGGLGEAFQVVKPAPKKSDKKGK